MAQKWKIVELHFQLLSYPVDASGDGCEFGAFFISFGAIGAFIFLLDEVAQAEKYFSISDLQCIT